MMASGGWRRHLYLWGVPIVVAAAAVSAVLVSEGAVDRLADLDPPASPVTMPVTAGSTDFNLPAALIIESAQRPAMIGGGLPGTVTAIDVAPGDELAQGDVLYRADGIAVTAYAGEEVFYRDLSTKARGEDVRAAQRFLADVLGRSGLATDGVFGATTEAAVRDFEKSIGIAKPTGTFRRAYVARIPADDYMIESVELELGGPAPAGGSELLTGALAVTSAVIEGGVEGPDGEYEFIYQGSQIPLERAEDGTWSASPEDAADFIGPDTPDGPLRLDGRTQLLGASDSQIVPGSAIISDPEGGECVALAAGESFDLMPVEIIGADVSGAAHLAPSLPTAGAVLINPQQILDSPTCPSN